MKSPAQKYGIDLYYLRRSKESTFEQKLNWLAAAHEFADAAVKKFLVRIAQQIKRRKRKYIPV